MNIYFCYHKNHDCGCYIAADTIGKAKAMYAKWDGMEKLHRLPRACDVQGR